MTTGKLDKQAVAQIMSHALHNRTPLGVYTFDGIEILSGDVLNCWVDTTSGFAPCPKYVYGFQRVGYFAYMGTNHAGFIQTDLSKVIRADTVAHNCSLADALMILLDYKIIMLNPEVAHG